MWRFWVALCLMALAILGSNARAELPPPKILLDDVVLGASLDAHTSFLVDPSGQLTINDIRTQALSDTFRLANGPVIMPGGKDAYWFAIRLKQTEFNEEWAINFASTTMQSVQFYGPVSQYGRTMQEPVDTGVLQPFATRPLSSEKFTMQARLELPGEYTFYIRLVSLTSRKVEFKLWDYANFFHDGQDKRLLDGLCYGIMLGLLVYNFSLWLVFRDRNYGLYVLSAALGTLSVASFNGHLAHYLLYDLPILVDRANTVLPALWITFGALFAHSFLDMSSYAARIGRVVFFLALTSVVTACMGSLGITKVAQTLNEVISLLLTVLIALAGVFAWQRGFGPARLYLLGWLLLFAAVVATVLSNWGVDFPLIVVDNAMQFGTSVELMVFALALSSRIRLLQSRQQELMQTAVHLERASTTDPLTGLLNRAGLSRQSAQLLVNDRRRTVILIDLDNFKPINDQYGHAAGDAVLVAVANRLSAHVRPGDLVARLGGDEFLLLLSEPNDRETVSRICERLLTSMAEPFAYKGDNLSVGLSLGISAHPQDGKDLSTLMHAADRALYHVKRSGRGTFAFFDQIKEHDQVRVQTALSEQGHA